MSSGRTNSVHYTPGTAPVGEVRREEEERRVGEVGRMESHRYPHRRPLSNHNKLVLMRKCKR